MQRDWDVIRTVMLELEAANTIMTELTPGEISGYPRDLICYNMIMLKDAGLADGRVLEAMGENTECVLLRLTFQGHELLDQIRSKPIWEKIKSYIKEHGMELSFEAVRTTAVIMVHAKLGI